NDRRTGIGGALQLTLDGLQGELEVRPGVAVRHGIDVEAVDLFLVVRELTAEVPDGLRIGIGRNGRLGHGWRWPRASRGHATVDLSWQRSATSAGRSPPRAITFRTPSGGPSAAGYRTCTRCGSP